MSSGSEIDTSSRGDVETASRLWIENACLVVVVRARLTGPEPATRELTSTEVQPPAGSGPDVAIAAPNEGAVA